MFGLDGCIFGIKVFKVSGDGEWDCVVMCVIEKVEMLLCDIDGCVLLIIILSFRLCE